MEQELKIRQVLCRCLQASLVDHDIEMVMACLTEDVIGIGLGDQGIVRNRGDLRQVLETSSKQQDKAEYSLIYETMDVRYIPPAFGTVSAMVRIERREKGKTGISKLMQSASLRLIDGEWLICSLHGSPVLISEESIESYPLKFAENTLAQLKEQLQAETFALMNKSIPGGVFGAYPDSSYPLYFINNGMLEYLGYTKDEFAAVTAGLFLNCVHKADRFVFHQTVQKHLNEGSGFELKYRIVKKDKSTIWMFARGHATTDERNKRIILCANIDVTEIMHLQQKLEEKAKVLNIKNAEMETLTNNVPGGVFTILPDKELTILYANSYFYELYGYTKEQMKTEHNNKWIQCICKKDLKFVVKTFKEACDKKKPFEFETEVIKRNGEIIWVLLKGSCILEKKDKTIHCVIIDITKRKQMEQELKLSEERFRIAFEKTSNIIFDYDILSNKIQHSGIPGEMQGFKIGIYDSCSHIKIGNKMVNADYTDDFLQMFRSICDGQHQAGCVVKVQAEHGKELWNRISLTGIKGQDGRPVRAIGLVEDITMQKEAELAYAREEQYRQAVLADSLASYIINFTKDRFESCSINAPFCLEISQGEAYDSFISKKTLDALFAEDRSKYLEIFSKENVLRAFLENKPELKLEYRFVKPDGEIIWLLSTMRLLLDSVTKEQKGFLYVQDIDKKKKIEMDLSYKSERDSLTGLYNKGAAETKIRSFLDSAEGRQRGIFLMIDVDHFKQINDTYGHPTGDRVLLDAAHGIQNIFNSNAVVGRVGGDEFCVFVCEHNSKQKVEEVAQKICDVFQSLPLPTKEIGLLSCSIGISFCSERRVTFEQIYREADEALYYIKENGRNGYFIFEECTKQII